MVTDSMHIEWKAASAGILPVGRFFALGQSDSVRCLRNPRKNQVGEKAMGCWPVFRSTGGMECFIIYKAIFIS